MQTWGQFIILMVTMVGMFGATWSATNRRLERLEGKTSELAERMAKVEAQISIILERLLPARASSD